MRTVNPEQHARKRAAILSAAAEEFAAHGVDGTTTAGICRRAGIGSGTLFHYFPTKRDIFHAMFADGFARDAELYEQALLTADPDKGLDLLLDHVTEELAQPTTAGLTAAAVLQANRDPEFGAMVAADEERLKTALVSLLSRMADAGRTLPLPPRRAARWIMTMIDARYLAAGDATEDIDLLATELRQIVGWLAGRRGTGH